MSEDAPWLGGPPGAGKTAVARLLTRRHGLRWYNADAHTWEHGDRALAAGSSAAGQRDNSLVEVRLSAWPSEWLAMSLRHECVDDVRALSSSPLVVAERTPSAAGPRAAWLLSSDEVRRPRPEEWSLSRSVFELHERLAFRSSGSAR